MVNLPPANDRVNCGRSMSCTLAETAAAYQLWSYEACWVQMKDYVPRINVAGVVYEPRGRSTVRYRKVARERRRPRTTPPSGTGVSSTSLARLGCT